ncbi:uncharacterized protein TNCV_2840801 [Trichonephila clavipes]|uniref:BED-type domain-containing protein n=1 Tax=Trichonephila clavipes TaxID=2585209 RepID=A0A8X6RN46_TRICX|nr:uncharacterized protein TNCV_2840801 [Trichonephila clavipes]
MKLEKGSFPREVRRIQGKQRLTQSSFHIPQRREVEVEVNDRENSRRQFTLTFPFPFNLYLPYTSQSSYLKARKSHDLRQFKGPASISLPNIEKEKSSLEIDPSLQHIKMQTSTQAWHLQRERERRIEEHRQFNRDWTESFAFMCNSNGLPTCLICHEKLAHNKKSNLGRHFTSKHTQFASKYPAGEERKKSCRRAP